MLIQWRRPGGDTARGRLGVAGQYRGRFGFTAFGSVAGPLAAGTASFVSSGPGGISLSATDATGGTGPYTYQWQRSATSGSGFSDLTGKTSLTCADATASAGTLYYFRLVYTDAVAATATGNEVSAQVYTGGVLTGGGVNPFRSPLIQGV